MILDEIIIIYSIELMIYQLLDYLIKMIKIDLFNNNLNKEIKIIYLDNKIMMIVDLIKIEILEILI